MTAPISVNAANIACGFVAPLPFGRAHPWNGLAEGQRWSATPGGFWQARLDPKGRAHVIGHEVEAMGQHPDPTRSARRWRGGPAGFDRACRVATLHNRMVAAAKGVGNG